MSEAIKHECGIAFLRLKKPLEYYLGKYGTAMYGINKMYLLMEKQHNRGQDGAGIANIKLDVNPGSRYISRLRSIDKQPIITLFEQISGYFEQAHNKNPENLKNIPWLKENLPFTGEVFLGHLRYGTYGRNSIESCHPFLRQNNWMSRNLVVAGNFNLTNVDELFNKLIELGQHPKEKADTVTVMERIGHFLDAENQNIFEKYKKIGLNNKEISEKITTEMNVEDILHRAARRFDGGYIITGLIGNGHGFVLRDPVGIRPAYYYEDDEVVVAASERPVIQTAFNLKTEQVKELEPGQALVVRKNGEMRITRVLEEKPKSACSFERIYFSRGSDKDIYSERKELGRLMTDKILKTVDYNLDNTVFSFIPNTAEVAFYGMVKGVEDYLNEWKKQEIISRKGSIDDAFLNKILFKRPRVEKIAIKDAKMRTFITDDDHRDELVTHVYDITYGTVKRGEDNIVVIDDSIVRGTTLKKSIVKMLDRLGPKKIVIVSSAPQIRYPDCYGIDMAKLGDFIAFKAAIELINERGMWQLINDTYLAAIEENKKEIHRIENAVKRIYEPFTDDEISNKIAELIKEEDVQAEVKVVYQSVENLHKACPGNTGDWYFTGNYPTPGGNRVVNRALINYVEGRNERAY